MFMSIKLFLSVSLILFTISTNVVDARPLHRRACKARKPPAVAATSSDDTPPVADPGSSVPAPAAPTTPAAHAQTGCFPSKGFKMPSGTPTTSLTQWWCNEDTEYGFLGFSYAVDACPSKSAMTNDFNNMQDKYGARYVRLYGACDRNGFNDDLVDAAYSAGVGLIPIAWFGYDGSSKYKTRLAAILNTIDHNPRAKYVIRRISIGSEALFDHAISEGGLVSLIKSTRNHVAKYNIAVGTSDMIGQYTSNADVFGAADYVGLNTLPFFSGDATSGGSSNAWSQVLGDIKTARSRTNNKKKVILTQTGWPSNQSVWKANSRSAVANVGSEQAYFKMLDNHCADFKAAKAGWMFHIYNDNALPGWGLVTGGGDAKFAFSAKTKC